MLCSPIYPPAAYLYCARHGAVCWGESIEAAYNGIERLEQICTLLIQTEMLGGARALPASEISALQAIRKRLGPQII